MERLIHVPGGRLLVVDEGEGPPAHMVGMERPAELAGLIMDFLEPLRPWD